MEGAQSCFSGAENPRPAVETLRLLIPLPDFIKGCASMSTTTNLHGNTKGVSHSTSGFAFRFSAWFRGSSPLGLERPEHYQGADPVTTD